MNNDWRNSDMAYGYRASRNEYSAGDSSDTQNYARYSARHAAPQGDRASYGSYDRGASYGRNNSASSADSYGTGAYGAGRAYDTRDAYESADLSRPSYSGGYSQNQNVSSYRGYGYSQSSQQSPSAYDSAYGYRAQASQTPVSYSYNQPTYQRPSYQQSGYPASHAQPSYGQSSYTQPSYTQSPYSYSQPSYNQPSAQASYARPAHSRPPYGEGAYASQSAYAYGAYASPRTQGTYQAPAQQSQQAAQGYASYYSRHSEQQRPVQEQSASEQAQARPAAESVPASRQSESAAVVRESRPVGSAEKKTQTAAAPKRPASRPVNGDQQELSDDMQSRLERMRQAGEAALRAQGYQQEDATAFMNTGMINLDAVIGSMEDGGVDPVISAQQTARMAVIRQAQQEAPLQQPATASLRAQNSRPGYTASKEEGTLEEQRKKSIWRSIIEWVVLLALAVGAAFLLRAYVVSFYLVQGSSMEPTFYTGQRLLVNKIGYTIGDIERFDVVVCRYPNSDNYYVKRVIALPGDTVYIENGTVYVNGQALDEDYVVHADENSMNEVVVEQGSYLVFGDNRVDSLDSRSIGAIEEDDILGRVIAVTWPVSDIASVKRLEDNVPNAGSYVPQAGDEALGEDVVDENADAGIGTTDIDPENNAESAVDTDANDADVPNANVPSKTDPQDAAAPQ